MVVLSIHSQITFSRPSKNTVLKIFEKVGRFRSHETPFPVSKLTLLADSISKKKKKIRARDVIFPRISDQKSVFLRIDLEKNFSKEFHKQYAILFRCLLHQKSYFSKRRGIIPSIYNIMHKYLYI